jgi:hypothetical protein
MLRSLATETHTIGFNELPNGCIEAFTGMVRDVNFKFDGVRRTTKNDHLLHYNWPLQHAVIFIRYGFNSINEKNELGRTALMNAAERGNILLVRYYISIGATLDDLDSEGFSALGLVLRSRWVCPVAFNEDGDSSYWETARYLVQAGADPAVSDTCDCACSISGCISTSVLPCHFGMSWSGYTTDLGIFLTFEWLTILEELQGEEALRTHLMSLIRRARFDEVRMTHTCLRQSDWGSLGLPWPETDRSKLELEEIRRAESIKRSQLEQDMERITDFLLPDLWIEWQQQVFKYHLTLLEREGSGPWESLLDRWHNSQKAQSRYDAKRWEPLGTEVGIP